MEWAHGLLSEFTSKPAISMYTFGQNLSFSCRGITINHNTHYALHTTGCSFLFAFLSFLFPSTLPWFVLWPGKNANQLFCCYNHVPMIYVFPYCTELWANYAPNGRSLWFHGMHYQLYVGKAIHVAQFNPIKRTILQVNWLKITETLIKSNVQ